MNKENQNQEMKRSEKPTPVLQEGMAYTLKLKDGRKIVNAIYYDCVATGKPYFGKGNDVYPIEDVHSYSLIGHNVSDSYRDDDRANPDRLAITDKVDEVINVVTTPDENPDTFRRRVKCLMISGMTQAEAEHIASTEPMKLELFYDIGRGVFAVEAEAVGNTPLYNPYTAEEIPDETA